MNPSHAYIPSNSIKIYINTSGGAIIDDVTTNFFTIPNLNYGALQSLSITRNINTVGLIATYTFTFQTNTNGALANGAGYVNIIFP